MIPNNYLPSGLYVCARTLVSTVSLANPYFQGIQPYREIEQEVGAKAQGLLNQFKAEKGCFTLKSADVEDYGRKIVEMARHFQESLYDAVLCPLRGSRMPSVQLATMCDSIDSFYAFDFSYGAHGDNDERVVHELNTIIGGVHSNSSIRIAVLDTAIGGQGSLALAGLLNDRVFPELGSRPSIDFHLMHAAESRPNRSDQIRTYDGFNVLLHPVESLLFEDESSLLGYETIVDADGSHVHPLTQAGKIALVAHDSVTVFETTALDSAAIGIVGHQIGKVMDSLEDVKLDNPNYWQTRAQS